jgi:hypothetical protein
MCSFYNQALNHLRRSHSPSPDFYVCRDYTVCKHPRVVSLSCVLNTLHDSLHSVLQL